MSQNATAIELFYGVYLLCCENAKYKGRTYIGYTVDPNRRIKQHNKGKSAGGARRTSNKGPWAMVLIVHGFPGDVSALRFEWAWQHPHDSRRLRHVARKKTTESGYDFRIRVLWEMLLVGPWNRLPLSVRWLSREHEREFPTNKLPPLHMPICRGPVLSRKLAKTSNDSSHHSSSECTICSKTIEGKPIRCLDPTCDLTTHVVCLANLFVPANEYIPIDGTCPSCGKNVLWGDLVRKYKGCYSNAASDVVLNTKVADDFNCSDSE